MTAEFPARPGIWEIATRLGRAIRDFATSEHGGRAAALAGALVAMLLAINALNIANSFVGRDFMTAIAQRDQRGFVRQALLYVVIFAGSTLAAVIYRFIEERLGLLWREWITRRLSGFYLDRHFYYRLSVDGTVANPDQRIADDARLFTTTTLSFALIFLNGTLTLIAFSGVLWSISRPLFATAVLYAALGSGFAYLIGRPLVRLNYAQSDHEADFRSQLVHVRSNAESIALSGREPQLRRRLFDQIGALADNLRRIIAVNRNLGFFTTGYNYMIQLIPALVVAPLFIAGRVEFGVISQSAMAFAQVIGAFSLIVNQFPQLSSYAAVLARLNTLGDAYSTSTTQPWSEITLVEDDARLAFDHLTLRAGAQHRPLVDDLSIAIAAGGRLLVTVTDDRVAAALLRALAGLWRTGSGRVVRPGGGGTLLLPERPYLPPGTVRALMTAGGAAPSDESVWHALHLLGVDGAVQRAGGLDVECDWASILSLDEQRLVAIATALLARPRFVVLEQLAADLGPDAAAAALNALKAQGIGYVVLGDRQLPHALFDVAVAIGPDGACSP